MATAGAADGRRQRSERSRDAVVDALLACYDDGTVQPSGAEIAERAGVSERSVFRHFEDLDALADQAFDRQFSRVASYFAAPSADGPLDERIDALVDQRARLHGRMANLARAAAFHANRSEAIAGRVRERQRFLAHQVERQFAPELGRLDARDRRLVLASLAAAVSFEGIEHLRGAADIGPRDLKVVLRRTLTAVLSAAAELQEHAMNPETTDA